MLTGGALAAALLAGGAVALWKTKQIPRPVAVVVAAVGLALSVYTDGPTAAGSLLPAACVLWVSGVAGWLYRRWRANQRRVPPTGRQREHRNADWTLKRAYRTPHDAHAVAERQGRHEGRVLSAYRCAVCGKWHVGHAHPGTSR